MTRKFIRAVTVSAVLIFIPAAGNISALAFPHLWVLLAFGTVASVLQPDYNPFLIAVKKGDKGTAFMIIWSVYLTQVAAVLEALYLRYPQSFEWTFVTTFALCVMVAGLALRTWAVFTLGNMFTMHIAVRENHQLVKDGPYRFFKHPSYIGAFFLYTATIIFLGAWFSAAAALLILPIAFWRRIRHEEAMLKQKFGAEYDEYCSRLKI